MPNSTRRRISWMLPVFGIALFLSTSCGGDDDSGPMGPPERDTTLTVSLDGGVTFSATSVSITASAGRLLIIGSGANVNEAIGLGFEVRTGSQSSGTGGTATASYALIGTGAWAAGPNLSASSGTLTLTTATANHVVGTFSFSLVSTINSTPATRQMSNGRIDIRY